MRKLVFVFVLFASVGFFILDLITSRAFSDDFTSEELTSSDGEKIYITSINWGVSADKQLSAVSRDPVKLKNTRDTLKSVYGLDPFIYRFENDTLTLFFNGRITYRVRDKFRSIVVQSVSVDPDRFREIATHSELNNGYHSVPKSLKQLPK